MATLDLQASTTGIDVKPLMDASVSMVLCLVTALRQAQDCYPADEPDGRIARVVAAVHQHAAEHKQDPQLAYAVGSFIATLPQI